jgi:hypothetical protein
MWLRRRQAYLPVPDRTGTRDDPDLKPLPPTVTGILAAVTDKSANDPEELLAVAHLPPGVLFLTGPGAADAARGLLVTVLLANARRAPGISRVLITNEDLALLLGPHTAVATAGLHVSDSLEAAAEQAPAARP